MMMRILVDSHFLKHIMKIKGNHVKVSVERESFGWYS